jgi:phenylalanyl-tRNA synthetase alpha subunit
MEQEKTVRTPQTFSRSNAVNYGKEVVEKAKQDIQPKIDKLIAYLASRYENDIKEALVKDSGTCRIEINVPSRYRVMPKNHNLYGEINEEIKAYFKPMGFNAELDWCVSFCLFKKYCRGNYKVRISWSRL